MNKLIPDDIVKYYDCLYSYKKNKWVEDTWTIRKNAGSNMRPKEIHKFDDYPSYPFDSITTVFNFNTMSYRNEVKNDYILKPSGVHRKEYNKQELDDYFATITDQPDVLLCIMSLLIFPRSDKFQPLAIITTDKTKSLYDFFNIMFEFNLSSVVTMDINGVKYIPSTKFHVCNTAFALNKKAVNTIISTMQANLLKKILIYTNDPVMTRKTLEDSNYICLDIDQKNNVYIDSDKRDEIISYAIDSIPKDQ
jgi:hypothetical protein